MQRVKIKEVKVEPGKTGDKEWKKTTVIGDDGSQFTTFDHKAEVLKSGDLIELEPIVKGRYVNFEKWNILEEAPAQPVHRENNRYSIGAIELEIDARARNTALMQACELAKIATIDTTSILNTADEFYSWLSSGQKQAGAVKVEKPIAQETKEIFPEEEQVPGTFQELLTWIASHGKTYTKTWVLNNLGMTEEEIKASPEQAYQELKKLMAW